MQREMTDDVKIADSIIPFQSVGKSPAVDKTVSNFDNANWKVRKIRRPIEQGIYDADIALRVIFLERWTWCFREW